jgi:hypothetical protein
MPVKTKTSNAGLLILLAGWLFTSCGTGRYQTDEMAKQEPTQPYDLIIVPGVPLENGQWSRIMKARVYWSKYLIEKGVAKNVMYSGGAVYTPYVEAEVMSQYAAAIGIPEENIFTESMAQHSTENIYYSYKKASKMGFKKIALATDPFQSRMLRRYIKNKVSSDVGLIPIIFDTLKTMESRMIDPQISFQPVDTTGFVALPERKGFFDRMRGTMGKHIDESLYN